MDSDLLNALVIAIKSILLYGGIAVTGSLSALCLLEIAAKRFTRDLTRDNIDEILSGRRAELGLEHLQIEVVWQYPPEYHVYTRFDRPIASIVRNDVRTRTLYLGPEPGKEYDLNHELAHEYYGDTGRSRSQLRSLLIEEPRAILYGVFGIKF